MREDIQEQNTLSPTIQKLNYTPGNIKAGIAHIGVGNFHRAHQAYYTHKLLNSGQGHEDWGIVGIGITKSGATMNAHLKDQDHLYSLTEYAADGGIVTSLIGAIVDYIPARADVEKAMTQLADPAIRIVSMTITEGGYKLDQHGKFMADDEDIVHDLQHPDSPRTAFGYITAALRRRRESGTGPFTVLSCDNLQHNGDVTKYVFLSFAEKLDPELASWIGENVSFPNSMVDRITPAVSEEDKIRLNQDSGIEDAIPVYAEDFTQWVIEDNFCAGRPEWELAGVNFVDDVSPYELLKLRFLNASHSMLAYPAFLAGYRNVDTAMKDPVLEAYLLGFMNDDVSPMVEVPVDVNLSLYKKQLFERFANPAVSDQLSRLCFHGGAKIPVFILPTLLDILQQKRSPKRIAFLFAAYAHYLKNGKDDNGEAYTVDAPKITAADWQLISHDDVLRFLSISPLASANLDRYPDFVKQYAGYRGAIAENGILKTLSAINGL
ncbi:mannitol dehydrogenase family protein [Pedobacter sp. MC2016-15]|uniref:mannitol dehydrogenase family protein n=1 Tax=Pedobacter sp. MC2016-15 TaxID=2994473 RepID=UPI0022457EDE|nr:mannitol dehydrogenase family protein [Pedobacter sp. MC2016-15]MCX2480195.1 mannitol dehydrogenase family protein [Pedobacter sp. MC2016-15]